LIKTTDQKIILLKNTSSSTLRGVKFKHLNCDELTAWSITSDYFTIEEEQTLKKNLIFDELKNVVYFQNKVEIAPKSQIRITLWGSFKDDIANTNVQVNYDEGDGKIERNYEISGLKGYLSNYMFEFFFLMILIFIIVYLIGIRYAKTRTNVTS
jgi:hypothetical protein